MRQIDWSPLVVLLAAFVAAGIESLIPDSVNHDPETTAVIIWIPLVLVSLRILRKFRANRNKPEVSNPGDEITDSQNDYRR
jgi:hypothetical protein